MKILIILSRWKGGVGVHVENISRELKKMGHEVYILAREDDLHLSSFLKSVIPMRRKIINLMKYNKYDIIYTQDWSIALSLIFPYPLFKNKHFCMFHGNQFGLGRVLQNIIGNIMGGNVFVIGDSLKERFKKSNLNYAGVDFDYFKNLGLKREYLGWIEKKGTEIIEEKDINRLAEKLNLKILIARNFSIPANKMNSEFYNKCKAFISIPPKKAGFNMCWLEAMAAGVPIIIGNEEGIGCRLPISRIYDKHFEAKKNYKQWLIDNEFTWKNHVKNLLRVFNRVQNK